MTSTLEHRGPDGWGVYLSPQMALGHTRLSIVDLATGDQPMVTERYVLVYNGEVYNYIELREELKEAGISFRTTSDTEVVLQSLAHFGPAEALKRFNGQFAFLFWDKQAGRLIAARDRYGIRPLYILNRNGALYFASEIKAFDTLPGYNREFEMENLYEHALLWNTLKDRTVYRNIRSLESGTFEVYEDFRLKNVFRYYELGESAPAEELSFSDSMEQFRELLKDSVRLRLRLRSDVPVGNYLSGGIDSSVTTKLTAELNRRRFKTFSIAFADSDFDESVYQEQMAGMVDSEHTKLTVNYDMIDNTFGQAVRHAERPLFRTAPVPLYLLSQEVRRKGIKVVLTGEAADEILWGYDSFKELKLLSYWKENPGSQEIDTLIRQLYPHLKHYSDPKYLGLMKMFYEGFLDSFGNELVGLNIRAHNNSILRNYFHKDFSFSTDPDWLKSRVQAILPADYHQRSLLKRNQFMEMKTLLQGYLLSSQGDRMSMSHSVEGRYPFLDHRLVEWLYHMPEEYKLKGFSQKHLLREAFKEEIPKEIIHRPKLPYMAPDLKSFFRESGPSEQTAYYLSGEKLSEAGVFDPRMVGRFMKKFSAGIPDTIGYRDNMLAAFILSTQILHFGQENPCEKLMAEEIKTVEIVDY